MTLLMLASGLICLILHRYIEVKNILSLKGITFKNKRTDILKLTMSESARMVFTSKYLAIICILMISYSTTVSLIEGLWMSRTKALYPDTADFMAYQGNVLFWTGIATLTFAFIGNTIVRSFGWFWGAIVTPLMILVAGGLFFASAIVEDQLSVIFAAFTTVSPLMIIVFIGGMQNILGKGAKYSLFDATKEMVYIPLDKELKTKGKAAVDVLGAKLGKSTGAAVQFLTFTIFPTANHEDIAGFLMSVFIIICLVWVYGVVLLNRNYQNILQKS
jgi:ATP/ADP translocase